MARKPKLVRFDGERHWFSIAHAASLIGTSQSRLAARALDGEFVFEPDKYGKPSWLLEAEITAVRATVRQAEQAKPKRTPRRKTAAQEEAGWAKISDEGARPQRDGPFLDMHLRLTLPRDDSDSTG